MNAHGGIEKLTEANIRQVARMERQALKHRSLGERLADRIAHSMGSWTFIVAQSSILGVWIAANFLAWAHHWDPYPFVLLNLVMSFQAAYASPIIMMSQNRQSKVDQLRNHLDLQINLLAEQELTTILRMLALLCEKSGVEVTENSEITALASTTRPSRILQQIESTLRTQVQPAANIAPTVESQESEGSPR